MKLLFVHQNLGEFGGAEANILISAEELRRRGNTVALLYTDATGRNEARWREIFESSWQLPGARNIEAADAVLESFAPDLIYVHNFSDLAVLERLLATERPVVRMVHDHALYCMRTYKYNYFTRKPCERAFSPACVFPCLASVARNREGGLPLKWVSYAEKQKELELSRRCQAFVTYSEHMKQELVRNGFPAHCIELCVPLKNAEDDGPTSSFSAQNLVLFAGQLLRGKGVDLLLKALARVRVPFRCVILGDGHHRAHCEALCQRLRLQDRVQFRGYVLPAEVRQFYLEASVFVMSSLWPEPFGMAGPEAMRYGLPVVAFDAGGIREWLHDGKNGYLASWGDTARFASRLERLLLDKELARRLGRAARESVKRYDVSRQVDVLEGIFQRVTHQTPALGAGASAPEDNRHATMTYD